jgi:hypothetical protein
LYWDVIFVFPTNVRKRVKALAESSLTFLALTDQLILQRCRQSNHLNVSTTNLPATTLAHLLYLMLFRHPVFEIALDLKLRESNAAYEVIIPFYAQFSEVKFKDIKLQKWAKYTLVIENRNIRLYIDNKLVSTKILPSIIAIGDIKSEIILGQVKNNYLGKILIKPLFLFAFKKNSLFKQAYAYAWNTLENKVQKIALNESFPFYCHYLTLSRPKRV